MVDNLNNLNKARDLIDKAKDIVIVTHENPTPDSIGSSLSLYLALKSLSKNVSVVAPEKVTVEHSNYIGVDKIKNEIGKRNFIISLDYEEGAIEKVSYNIEGNKFNLVIEPRSGWEPFSQNKVHYSYGGNSADLIIVIDTLHFGQLRDIYEKEKNTFSSAKIINIDSHTNNANFGTVNLVGSGAATVELVSQLLSILGVKLNEDIATNILNALYEATANFTSNRVSGKTFDLAASCIKSGARKFFLQSGRENYGQNQMNQDNSGAQSAGPVNQPAAYNNRPNIMAQTDTNSAQNENKPGEVQIPPTPPSDWFKPKIFKSSNQ